MKNCNDTIGNRTRDLTVFSAVPQTTTCPRMLNLVVRKVTTGLQMVNLLMLNDHYMGRTAELTSRRCILYIYSTNIRTEYFKHAA